MSSMRWL
jgi:hypothetical protein